jgi:hypothetical protein
LIRRQTNLAPTAIDRDRMRRRAGSKLEATPRLEIDLSYPDARDAVRCSHPGMSDSFAVRLTLDIHRADHTISASFGEVHAHRGACSVGGPLARGDGGVAAAALFVLAAALARRPRDRRSAGSVTLGHDAGRRGDTTLWS